MYVHGQFVNQKGDIVEVRILTKNDNSTSYEIGTKKSGIYFNDDPIEIEDETNDVFDVILSQSATITLLVADFIPEFFQLSALDAKVNIYCAGKLVFAGYIEPQTYSQDFNEIYDELELTCIDALSALQYSQYKNVTNSSNYTTAKAAAEQVTFKELVRDILNGVGANLYISENGVASGTPSIFYDGNVKTATSHTDIFTNTSINELLFFDDDEDSIWTHEDVLQEVLRYLNLHVREIDGDFYIFDWSTVKDNTKAAGNWYQINIDGDIETSLVAIMAPTVITLSSSNVEDTDTQISVEDSYNQIQVECDRAEIEELAISPLDEDSLVAPFPRRTLYCTELMSYPDNDEDYSYNKWSGHMKAGLQDMYRGDYQSDTDKRVIHDYYVQIFRNANWSFRSYGYDEYKDCDVYSVADWMADEHALLDHVSCSPAEGSNPKIVPCIVKISKTKEKHTMSEAAKEFDDETTYLVIPVRGYDYYYDVTNDTSWSAMTGRCKGIYDMGGLIQCVTASAGGSLSPSDEDTTNYIVIEGKVLLQQAAYSSYESYYNADAPHKGSLPEHRVFTTCGNPDDLPDGIRSFDDRVRWLSDDGDDKSILRAMYWFDPQGNRHDADHYKTCFYPPVDSSKYLKFTYNEEHDDWDTIDKVSVLDCMLKVGDKYCVEIFEDYTDSTGHKRTKSTMKWLKEDECPQYTVVDTDGVTRTYTKKTFSIGIDPEPGDNIIGEECDIANTLNATDNIDAEGTAIPIKQSDKLSGKVEFSIIGPVNGSWNEVYRRHPTMFRSTKWADNPRSILDNCSAIYISDFKIGIYSDNGKVTSGDDKDLVYMSDEDATYRNVQECDDFKINSALTSDECIALGVTNQVCLSNPSASDGSAVLAVYNEEAGVEAKPEQLYVDAYYRECHQPKIKMEQNMQDKGCALSMFDTYIHPALPGKKFFIQGAGRNLMEGSLTLTLRQI